jgi:hypothetical protein
VHEYDAQDMSQTLAQSSPRTFTCHGRPARTCGAEKGHFFPRAGCHTAAASGAQEDGDTAAAAQISRRPPVSSVVISSMPTWTIPAGFDQSQWPVSKGSACSAQCGRMLSTSEVAGP